MITKYEINHSMGRLVFVDQLKGVAIFLVIIGHVYNFSLVPSFSYVPTFISMIHMPVFMFIAGYMFHRKDDSLKVIAYFYSMCRKFQRIMLPFISFTIIVCVLRDWNYCDLLMNEMKYGYWFLLTLFMFYLVYYPFLYLSMLSKYIELLVYLILSVLLILLCKYIFSGGVKSLLSLDLFAQYSFPFLIGMWLNKYRIELKILQNERKNILYTILITLFLIAFYLFVQIEYGSFFGTVQSFGLRFVMIGISGLICWIFFSNINLTNKLGSCLSWLGMNSLPIYVLHYFFLPDSAFFVGCVDSIDGVILLSISVLISLLTLSLTVISYKVLSYSALLQRFLFGK